MMNIARVRFERWGNLYDYLNDLDLEIGNKVVVETDSGLAIAEVAAFASHSDYAHRWVIQKIDDKTYKQKAIEHKKEQWSNIKRDVGELKVGDIVYSLKHERLFELTKLDKDGQIFCDLEDGARKEFDDYEEIAPIYLTYPVEARVSIHIDWNDVQSFLSKS